MRGDPPFQKNADAVKAESTPHARGSTFYLLQESIPVVVYPACAGIHLKYQAQIRHINGLPRMRGDPPLVYIQAILAA